MRIIAHQLTSAMRASAKVLVAVALSLLAGPGAVAQSSEGGFLVKPYLQFSTQTGMYVLWETRQEAATSVRFGEARMGASQPILDREAGLPGKRLMHEVMLADLKPETNYFWQAISVVAPGDTLRSEVYTFKTAVKDSSAYMFALVGDTQRNPRTPWAWEKIAQRVWSERPNFVVHVGDVVDQGLRKADWVEHFFPFGHILMSRVPVYTVLGNHEQDSPLYYQYMVAPPPEYYYTFTYGNCQFFMIDSNRDVSEGSEQYQWLEWELARSTATWKIALHHHPPYSSDNDDHGDTYSGLSTLSGKTHDLTPLYERYGLDFCLFGHIHVYERSWPLKEDLVNMKEGVVYINSGGAGGGIEAFAPTRSWFTVEHEAVHHYCTFNVFDNNVVFKAIDYEGRLIDAFQMQKDRPDQRRAGITQPPGVRISAAETLFERETSVRLEAAFDSLDIRYTLDGSEPGLSSPRYTQPFVVSESALVRARAYTRDGRAGRVTRLALRKSAPLPPVARAGQAPGLRYAYYEGDWQRLPDFGALKPSKTGVCPQAGLAEIPHADKQFAVVMEGFVEAPQTGRYTFFINSDDGSRLYIDGELVVDHDGTHSAMQKTGELLLAAGRHAIRIEYFQQQGGSYLQAGVVDPFLGVVPFSPGNLWH